MRESIQYNFSMRINIARGLIGLVILFNLQAALVFLLWPGNYISAFELQGVVGEAMLRGLGVLFLMWNVPYLVALWNPIHYRVSLYEALAMQIIGLVGEAVIYTTIPDINNLLIGSIYRFITFDALGLLLLILATIITRKS
jgi:hypothetical protein